MTMRTTDKIVTFHRPFCLNGVDRVLDPANYRVVTDEVDLAFVAAFLIERDAAIALGEQLDGSCQQC